MKNKLFTATIMLVLLSVNTAQASNDETEATNNARNSIAIGGNSTGSTGFFTPGGYSFRPANEAVAGSIVMDSCGCWDDMYLDNTSKQALAVGNAGAGSIIIE